MLHIVAGADERTSSEGGLVRKRAKVTVKAQFMLDGQTTSGLTFLDEKVAIPHFDDCAFKDEDDKVADIAIGMYST